MNRKAAMRDRGHGRMKVASLRGRSRARVMAATGPSGLAGSGSPKGSCFDHVPRLARGTSERDSRSWAMEFQPAMTPERSKVVAACGASQQVSTAQWQGRCLWARRIRWKRCRGTSRTSAPGSSSLVGDRRQCSVGRAGCCVACTPQTLTVTSAGTLDVVHACILRFGRSDCFVNELEAGLGLVPHRYVTAFAETNPSGVWGNRVGR